MLHRASHALLAAQFLELVTARGIDLLLGEIVRGGATCAIAGER